MSFLQVASLAVWLESVYTLLNMHCGPMWKVETTNIKVPISLPKSQVIDDVNVNLSSKSNSIGTYVMTSVDH